MIASLTSRRWAIRAAGLLLVVALIATGATWWFAGGAHLEAAGADGGSLVAVGTPRNIAVELTAHGGAVKLVSARAVSTPANMTVRFVAANLTGARDGELAVDGIHVGPVRDARVTSERSENATNLAIVVTAQRAGVYALHDIEITYRAGARTRTVRVHMDQCILAVDGHDLSVVSDELERAEQGKPIPTYPRTARELLVAQYTNGCTAA